MVASLIKIGKSKAEAGFRRHEFAFRHKFVCCTVKLHRKACTARSLTSRLQY